MKIHLQIHLLRRKKRQVEFETKVKDENDINIKHFLLVKIMIDRVFLL